jgi:NhaP-type Na+/H+ or K+/H+ antiporter
VIAIVLTLLGRAAAVYPLAAIFNRSGLRLPATYQHVLVWGGLRGAVGLALALAVPGNVPERAALVVLTFGVVAFSIFAQGRTMPPLLRRRLSRLSAPPGEARSSPASQTRSTCTRTRAARASHEPYTASDPEHDRHDPRCRHYDMFGGT